MTRQRRAWAAAAAGVAAAVFGYFAFSGGEEAEIHEAFRLGAAAAERGDVEAVARLLDEDFRGRINLLASYSQAYLETRHGVESSLGKAEAIELIEQAFDRSDDRRVKIDRLDIDLQGESARIHCEFSVKGKYEGSVYNVPFKIRITAGVEMAKREGVWRIIRSEIQDIAGETSLF